MKTLAEIIEAECPMPLDRYMELCLAHPEHGYYMRQQPFGTKGDFTTAPEISQMFGELIGLWLVHMWQMAGAPSRITLLELGPGRGTLMADILRVARQVPAFLQAAQIYLLESSERLRNVQLEALSGFNVTHLNNLDALSNGPLYVVANEFFDALPIRQFVKNDFGWQERLVEPGPKWGLSNTVNRPDLDSAFEGIETGRIVERCAAARGISEQISQHIAQKGGAALLIDYGEFDGVGDTFQAVKAHKKVDVFSAPGEADLTAHVRFKDLVQSGVSYGFTTQGAFLNQLGIDARRQVLETTGSQDIATQQRRLTDPAEMGALFKVLALVPKGNDEMPGFANEA